jgi:hypothetical protein
MTSVRNLVAYSRDCEAVDCEDVLMSYETTRKRERYLPDGSNTFNGFHMLPGVANSAAEAENEILDRSYRGGPAYGKLYVTDNNDVKELFKKKQNAAQNLSRKQAFYNKSVLEYNQRLLAKSPDKNTQCVSCKSNINNSHIHKCLSQNKCIVCDGKFQNYTISENMLQEAKDNYNSIQFPYKAVWGGWI